MTTAAQAAAGVTLPPTAVTPAARNHERFAREATEILTNALARDDERRRHACPLCGHTRHNEDRS